VARSARRFASNATISLDQSLTATTCGISARRREGLGRVADAARGRVLEGDDRQADRRDLGVVADDHVGLHLGAPHEERWGKQQHAGRARRLRVLRQLDGLGGAVGVHTGDDRARARDLVERHRQRMPALLARERGHLGRVAIGDDAGYPGRVGEPAEVLTVGRLVDGQVGPEGRMLAGMIPENVNSRIPCSLYLPSGRLRRAPVPDGRRITGER